ncbi:MAG: branched-chain amino acid ABC transporter permease [Deltaproteobacteria bacterium]|jgi:branched-chain amino acid transport system permease protein|nr:branched-chain amino acid ABC transporter permease [Deltaproteobacteria bacterium]MBW1748607.1 branched-chain amino acid ABC transporter permease [Deltaproteobacteria bacterium]MBW1969936.1 branched-chain amino acid ABC transporter permease [Deltaproteobacteria bacterium]MBW2199042.1 branched-chain amino acid ABC transporter permease [Deltaproteobacteria bacterium]MBW2226982.1 branched-chain amino acid ABC transporter permease [Deltaproteobacteria bacterium]
MVFFFQNLVNALQWGSFYALIALGYSMVYGILMLFNFAHGDIFMVGAYIGFGVATGITALASFGAIALPNWLILVLTIIISMFLTSFVGILVERLGYRPLREAPRASAAITGLMIGIILETGNLALLGAKRVRFPSLIKSSTYNIGGVFVTNKKIMIVVVSLLLMFALHQFVRRTKWGMAMRAMAFDYVVVPLMGVPINTIAAMTFAIGSALAAAAGILFGIAYPVLDPYMGIVFGWKAFVAAILGGRGSILGATLAGFLLGFIEIFVAMIFPSTLRDLIAYSIILLILAFRPHGFFGEPYSARLRL